MTDIRVIKIVDDEVMWTDEMMDVPLSDYEAAVQRIMVALYTTPGSKIESPNFGGGITRLERKVRNSREEDTSILASDIILQTVKSLRETEDYTDPWAVYDIILDRVERMSPRGVLLNVKVYFQEALAKNLKITSKNNVY